MTDAAWWVVGVIGFLLQGPMLLASVQTGPSRMFTRASITFEQRLIDSWLPLLGMFAVGAFAWATSGVVLGLPWWLMMLKGGLDGWIISSAMRRCQNAQDYLNFRLANESGEFWCKRCQEVHKIGEPHV